ncbi:MAG: helix-turn-helix transcriptional regulator [Planctomycetota bacterium]
MDFHYEELEPAPDLRRYVRCYWVLRAPKRSPEDLERIFPDGCTEIVLHRRGVMNKRHEDGHWRPQARSLIAGQLENYLELSPDGATDLFAVRFEPFGLARFLPVPAWELRDLQVDVRELNQPLADVLDRHSEQTTTTETLVQAVETELRKLADISKEIDPLLESAATLIEARGGNVSMDDLLGRTGYSARQLERRFRDQLGLSPKKLARVVRFQRLLDAASNCDEPDWSALSIDCGYYDQPHMIREFKSFTGVSPAAHFAAEESLADYVAGSETFESPDAR